MDNKYLEKIARMDRDYDAHSALVAMAEKPKASNGGWQGDMNKFNTLSKSRMNGVVPSKPVAKGIFSKIVSKIAK